MSETPQRRRKTDSLWAAIPKWAELAAVITVAILLLSKATDLGGSVQAVNDNVRIYANRNCQVSADIVSALRLTIASEIHTNSDRQRILALFPPVDCSVS